MYVKHTHNTQYFVNTLFFVSACRCDMNLGWSCTFTYNIITWYDTTSLRIVLQAFVWSLHIHTHGMCVTTHTHTHTHARVSFFRLASFFSRKKKKIIIIIFNKIHHFLYVSFFFVYREVYFVLRDRKRAWKYHQITAWVYECVCAYACVCVCVFACLG